MNRFLFDNYGEINRPQVLWKTVRDAVMPIKPTKEYYHKGRSKDKKWVTWSPSVSLSNLFGVSPEVLRKTAFRKDTGTPPCQRIKIYEESGSYLPFFDRHYR